MPVGSVAGAAQPMARCTVLFVPAAGRPRRPEATATRLAPYAQISTPRCDQEHTMPSHEVLIIDDEPDIREVARVSLELVAGWEVITASSGAEGIERAI